MNESSRLPAGLRHRLEHALELVRGVRDPRQSDEEILVQLLEDLRAAVTDALEEVRSSDFPGKQSVVRPLRVADGILLYLDDPSQRDARGRLRDVETRLREILG